MTIRDGAFMTQKTIRRILLKSVCLLVYGMGRVKA